MLVRIDQDNIGYYFPVQNCSWALDQHGTSSFCVQCWQRQIKTTLYRLFSCENAFVRVCVFGQHWLDNIPMQCGPSMVDTTLYKLCISWKLSVCHGATLHRWFPCAMLTQKIPDTIVDYFPLQGHLWTVKR